MVKIKKKNAKNFMFETKWEELGWEEGMILFLLQISLHGNHHLLPSFHPFKENYIIIWKVNVKFHHFTKLLTIICKHLIKNIFT